MVDPVEHFLALLFEEPELETLVQLGLLDLPQLQQLLLPRVDLVQQLHDLGDAGLHVRVGHHARHGRTPSDPRVPGPRVPGVVAAAACRLGVGAKPGQYQAWSLTQYIGKVINNW